MTLTLQNSLAALNTFPRAEIATARGQSLFQVAIVWLLAKPYVTDVLMSASRWAQIEDNLGALRNTSLSNNELAAIDRCCQM